ncbi:MAG: hypothetical protein KDK50_01935 [Chlamydiia bacterium]|nr:hypothetical protein [Chlamydiia bacterium]
MKITYVHESMKMQQRIDIDIDLSMSVEQIQQRIFNEMPDCYRTFYQTPRDIQLSRIQNWNEIEGQLYTKLYWTPIVIVAIALVTLIIWNRYAPNLNLQWKRGFTAPALPYSTYLSKALA